MKRRVFLAGGSAIAIGGAAAAAFGFGGGEGTAPRSNQAPKTAEVTKATLVDYEEVDGELGFGEPVPLRYNAQAGLVTWLPPVGSTVERGQPLFKVDNVPVPLLFGALPLYRALTVGVTGPDVKQLEENLRALGHGSFAANEEFNSVTAGAVRKWQKALGVTETGVIAPGQLLYTAGAIRIAAHKVRVGDQAGGEIVTYTGNIRRVIVALPVNQQRFAVAGGIVQVTLPDGKAVEGKVETIGAVASTSQSEGAGPVTVPVTISIADQAAIGAIQQGPAKVRFLAEERKDVLTVPIAALVALAEGGYGIQVIEGSTSRYVAVETGMFANGRVEIRGNGVQAGMKVGVPK